MIYELEERGEDKSVYLKCLKVWTDRDTSRKEKWLSDMSGRVKILIGKDAERLIIF